MSIVRTQIKKCFAMQKGRLAESVPMAQKTYLASRISAYRVQDVLWKNRDAEKVTPDVTQDTDPKGRLDAKRRVAKARQEAEGKKYAAKPAAWFHGNPKQAENHAIERSEAWMEKQRQEKLKTKQEKNSRLKALENISITAKKQLAAQKSVERQAKSEIKLEQRPRWKGRHHIDIPSSFIL
mmetsp:Transcript_31060/g.41046  ORF Transcript_31060/g.41046 Transcript_31060/m.41046 type:complete len:181 (+) Transcript_31060:264-806(+)